MKKEKKNNLNKKSKKYKMTKRTWTILTILIIVIGLIVLGIVYINSERYQKNKMEKLVSKWAEEYYTDELVNVASGYINTKTQNDESITINLDALKSFGKDIEKIKNNKTGKQCDDIDSYVSIKVDKDAKDISKDYEIEKVVLDCFE